MISAVIPTFNAAAILPATLTALRSAPQLGELVVADGGSLDDTVAVALAMGARAVAAPRGRGPQLAAGAEAAQGDWLLFVHADSRPLPGWEAAAAGFIATGSGMAGYFALALDDEAPAARRLERMVAWRCRRLALPYGDQGLLIARQLYEAVGGYRAIPLMEDVDLVRRLGHARLAPLQATMLTSAGRYRRDGYRRRGLRNLLCLSLYFAGVPPQAIVRVYG
ncbi:MAG: TIGR04283 family arsenosugar biosynthesis glycosyltransferase [Alphaproteobacteria bacterium]|nr:TIGR04283 family arsenosugar biosynthesis glycosyltransferase [Alphaproteobacteria bacterium]